MQETFGAVAWAVIFTVAGGLIGICLVLLATLFIPKVLARLTPNMNEDKAGPVIDRLRLDVRAQPNTLTQKTVGAKRLHQGAETAGNRA